MQTGLQRPGNTCERLYRADGVKISASDWPRAASRLKADGDSGEVEVIKMANPC